MELKILLLGLEPSKNYKKSNDINQVLDKERWETMQQKTQDFVDIQQDVLEESLNYSISMKQQIEIGRKRQTILLPKIESNSYIESIDE
jgi:hypothetical protein